MNERLRILAGFSELERAHWVELFGEPFPPSVRCPSPIWHVPEPRGPDNPKPFTCGERRMVEAMRKVNAA